MQMDSSNLHRLNDCIEVARSLSNPRKVVEDDTCMERILTTLEKILKSYTSEILLPEIEDFLRKLEENWELIKIDVVKYCPASINYLLKLNAIFLSSVHLDSNCWKSSVKFIAEFPLLFLSPGSTNCNNSFSPSIGYSWINSIRILISPKYGYKEVCSQINIDHVIHLCEVPSIFVHKEACKCLAEFVVSHSADKPSAMVQQFKTKVYNAITKSLLVNSTLEIITKMLLNHYHAAVMFLSFEHFNEYIDSHNDQILELCVSSNALLCHLFHALFNEHTDNEIPDVTENVISCSTAFQYSVNAIISNPTKSVGWNMLTSVLMHCPYLENDSLICGKAIISYPIDMLFGDKNVISKDIGIYKKYTEKVMSMHVNRTKMTAIFRNSLESISKLWKTNSKFYSVEMMERLLKIFDYIGNMESTYALKDDSSIIAENWNIMDVLMNLMVECFDKFGSSNVQKQFKITLLSVMGNRNANNSVCCLCQRLVIKILSIGDDIPFLNTCLEIKKLKLHDRRWEIRDSALEFLSQLLLLESNNMTISSNFKKHYLDEVILHLVNDSNSFVKATALLLLKDILIKTNLFDDCIDTVVLPSLLNILTNEREAAPRRAAVFAFLECLKKKDSLVESFLRLSFRRKNMKGGITSRELLNKLELQNKDETLHIEVLNAVFHCLYGDLDWEVKFNAIDILEYFIRFVSSNMPSVTRVESDETCQYLKKLLEYMFEDCDTVVGEKAKNLCHELFPQSSELSEQHHTATPVDKVCLAELDSLLEDVLGSLRQEQQKRLTHGCHGPSIDNDLEYDDSVVLDCY
uniref:uncharacterized protein LOC120343079 n=1 Tax=Styela clava TaxID=7725 RepID=UPI001939DC5A|nr:uncharacterized protein LOC120343079 [Styela clava]